MHFLAEKTQKMEFRTKKSRLLTETAVIFFVIPQLFKNTTRLLPVCYGLAKKAKAKEEVIA